MSLTVITSARDLDSRHESLTAGAEIAAAAGLTARTLLGHVGDKPEVPFAGSDDLLVTMARTLEPATVAGRGPPACLPRRGGGRRRPARSPGASTRADQGLRRVGNATSA